MPRTSPPGPSHATGSGAERPAAEAVSGSERRTTMGAAASPSRSNASRREGVAGPLAMTATRSPTGLAATPSKLAYARGRGSSRSPPAPSSATSRANPPRSRMATTRPDGVTANARVPCPQAGAPCSHAPPVSARRWPLARSWRYRWPQPLASET